MNNNSTGANHITPQVPLNVMKYTMNKVISGAKNSQVTVLGDTTKLVINNPSTRLEQYQRKKYKYNFKSPKSKSASVGPQYEVEGEWVSSDPFRVNKDVPLPYCCKVTAYRSNHIRWLTRWALIQKRQVLLGSLVPD